MGTRQVGLRKRCDCFRIRTLRSGLPFETMETARWSNPRPPCFETSRLGVFVVVCAGLWFGSGKFANAANFTVTKENDSNSACTVVDCSLRAAISAANANPGPDVINLPAGTYTLSMPGVNEDFNATGDLDIYDDLTINGAGANTTIIDGNGIDRVLHIRGSANVDISELTIKGGNAPDLGGLVIGAGGGIYTTGALLTLTNVAVRDNRTQSSHDPSEGGGIFVAGPVTLNNCTVSGNSATYGGGIDNYINGPLIVNNSTISGNAAAGGGGIVASNYGNTLILNNSTVSSNTSQIGGGLHQQAGTVIVKNTILARNTGGNCAFTGNSPSALISYGHNLSTDVWCEPAHIVNTNVTGGLNGPGDRNNVPANLAPLALNAPGTTMTHALCTGPGTPDPTCGGISPAIDAVPLNSYTVCTDQRGVSRPQGISCDIGAFENVNTQVIPPPNCDDGNPCTDDSCDAANPATGCKHLDNTASCDDGDLCTLTDKCQSGSCVGGNPVICTALDQCHQVGVCDPNTGQCLNPLASDGINCDDGLICTTNDRCLGGVCTGDSTSVTSPPNDLCSNAKTVPNGTYLFNTCGATTSPAPPASTQIYQDIWYRFVAPCGGTVTVDTCGSLFDTVLAVYDGSFLGLGCNGPPVVCNNDAVPGSCGGSLQSFVSFPAMANNTYYIRIGAFSSGVVGSGRLTISGPFPNPSGCTCPSIPSSPGNTTKQLYQFSGTANGTPGAWCLRAPCCFECEDLNVPGALDMQTLLNNFTASVNSKGCGGKLQAAIIGNPNNGKFSISASCGTGVPFQFRVGHSGPTSCDVLSVVVPAGAVLDVPAQYNPDVYEVPLSHVDCNGNGEDDMIDILDGTSADVNGNGVPDECDVACVTDADCGDGNACTVDSCDAQTNLCIHTSNVSVGQCCNPTNGALTPLDDGNLCTVDACDPATGAASYTAAPISAICNDGIPCTYADSCDDAGICAGLEVNTIVCANDQDCPAGTCDPNSGLCHCQTAAVPTVSEWGLVVLTLLGLMAGAKICFARRQTAAA